MSQNNEPYFNPDVKFTKTNYRENDVLFSKFTTVENTKRNLAYNNNTKKLELIPNKYGLFLIDSNKLKTSTGIDLGVKIKTIDQT